MTQAEDLQQQLETARSDETAVECAIVSVSTAEAPPHHISHSFPHVEQMLNEWRLRDGGEDEDDGIVKVAKSGSASSMHSSASDNEIMATMASHIESSPAAGANASGIVALWEDVAAEVTHVTAHECELVRWHLERDDATSRLALRATVRVPPRAAESKVAASPGTLTVWCKSCDSPRMVDELQELAQRLESCKRRIAFEERELARARESLASMQRRRARLLSRAAPEAVQRVLKGELDLLVQQQDSVATRHRAAAHRARGVLAEHGGEAEALQSAAGAIALLFAPLPEVVPGVERFKNALLRLQELAKALLHVCDSAVVVYA